MAMYGAAVVAIAALGVRVMAAENAEFQDAFKKLFAASKEDFKGATDGKAEVTDDGDQLFDSAIELPGVKRAKIWLYKDPTLAPSYRSKFLIDGKDKDKAEAIYKDLTANVKAALPDSWEMEEYTVADRHMEGMEALYYPSQDDRSVTVNMKRDRKTNLYTISLVIDAKDR